MTGVTEMKEGEMPRVSQLFLEGSVHGSLGS